jgi:hypothetical protein
VARTRDLLLVRGYQPPIATKPDQLGRLAVASTVGAPRQRPQPEAPVSRVCDVEMEGRRESGERCFASRLVSLKPRAAALLVFVPCRSDDGHAAAPAEEADQMPVRVSSEEALIIETGFQRKDVDVHFARKSRPVGLMLVGSESWGGHGRPRLLPRSADRRVASDVERDAPTIGARTGGPRRR